MLGVKRSGPMVLLSWSKTPYTWAMRPSVASALGSGLIEMLKTPRFLFPKSFVFDTALPPLGMGKRYEASVKIGCLASIAFYELKWVHSDEIISVELTEDQVREVIVQIKRASMNVVVRSSRGDEFI